MSPQKIVSTWRSNLGLAWTYSQQNPTKIMDDKTSWLEGFVRLALILYTAPLDTWRRLTFSFEQSERKKSLHFLIICHFWWIGHSCHFWQSWHFFTFVNFGIKFFSLKNFDYWCITWWTLLTARLNLYVWILWRAIPKASLPGFVPSGLAKAAIGRAFRPFRPLAHVTFEHRF